MYIKNKFKIFFFLFIFSKNFTKYNLEDFFLQNIIYQFTRDLYDVFLKKPFNFLINYKSNKMVYLQKTDNNFSNLKGYSDIKKKINDALYNHYIKKEINSIFFIGPSHTGKNYLVDCIINQIFLTNKDLKKYLIIGHYNKNNLNNDENNNTINIIHHFEYNKNYNNNKLKKYSINTNLMPIYDIDELCKLISNYNKEYTNKKENVIFFIKDIFVGDISNLNLKNALSDAPKNVLYLFTVLDDLKNAAHTISTYDEKIENLEINYNYGIEKIRVDLFNEEDRDKIIKYFIKKYDIKFEVENLIDILVKLTIGFNYSEIKYFINNISLLKNDEYLIKNIIKEKKKVIKEKIIKYGLEEEFKNSDNSFFSDRFSTGENIKKQFESELNIFSLNNKINNFDNNIILDGNSIIEEKEFYIEALANEANVPLFIIDIEDIDNKKEFYITRKKLLNFPNSIVYLENIINYLDKTKNIFKNIPKEEIKYTFEEFYDELIENLRVLFSENKKILFITETNNISKYKILYNSLFNRDIFSKEIKIKNMNLEDKRKFVEKSINESIENLLKEKNYKIEIKVEDHKKFIDIVTNEINENNYFKLDIFIDDLIRKNIPDIKIEKIEKEVSDYNLNLLLTDKRLDPTFKPDLSNPEIKYDDLIIDKKTKKELDNILYFIDNLKNDEDNIYNINAPRGLIFYGLPGTGKTTIAKSLAKKANIPIFVISYGDISSKWVGESEKNIDKLFKSAIAMSPSMLVIDEIDSFAPNRKTNGQDYNIKFVNQLLTSLDEAFKKNVIVIGTTNSIDRIDSAIIRPGRIDNHLEIKLPNKNLLKEISKFYIKKYNLNFSNDLNIDKIVSYLSGFSQSAIYNLFGKIREIAIRENKKIININDFEKAYNNAVLSNASSLKYKPYFGSNDIGFSDIGGLDKVKEELAVTIDYLKNPNKYLKNNIQPIKGLLFYGPPGTGKTYFAKAIAKEAAVPIFIVTRSDIISSYVGESEKNLKELFETARSYAPSIIFIDEIDSIAQSRKSGADASILNEMLIQIDGFKKSSDSEDEDPKPVVVIGATNRLEEMDPAILRSGRLEKQILIDVPYKNTRVKIIDYYLKKLNIKLSNNITSEDISNKLIGFSQADIASYLNKIALTMVKNNLNILTMELADEIYKEMQYGFKQDWNYDEEDIKTTAVHEAGHALIMILNKDYPYKLETLTIEGRSRFLGAAFSNMIKDIQNLNIQKIIACVDVALGGKAAEVVYFGKQWHGASSDLKNATNILRDAINNHGLIGNTLIYGGLDEKETNKKIEEILQERFKFIKNVLINNKKIFDIIINELLIKKTLYPEDIKKIIDNNHAEKAYYKI